MWRGNLSLSHILMKCDKGDNNFILKPSPLSYVSIVTLWKNIMLSYAKDFSLYFVDIYSYKWCVFVVGHIKK